MNKRNSDREPELLLLEGRKLMAGPAGSRWTRHQLSPFKMFLVPIALAGVLEYEHLHDWWREHVFTACSSINQQRCAKTPQLLGTLVHQQNLFYVHSKSLKS